MPCEHSPVTIFPNAFTYIAINGEQVMTLGAVSLVAHTSGVLPIDRGGTNATTPEQARINLGLGSAATSDASAFATASQGALADTAMQPGDDAADLGSDAAIPAGYALRADGAGGAAWEDAGDLSDGDTLTTGLTFPVAGLHILDTNASHDLILSPGSDLTEDRTLTLTTGDSDRTLTIGASASVSGSNTGDQDLSGKADLAGRAGGQTLIGGTAVGDALSLQGTTGNGTASGAAINLNVGNNGALTALSVANNGQMTLKGGATTDLPVTDEELLTSAGWTVGAGWTESPDDTFAHASGGGTATLTHSATITSGYKYQISWTVSEWSTGSFSVAVGGVSLSGQTATGSFYPTATATTEFTITPTDAFDGKISLVSLKQMTAVSTPILVGKSSDGTTVLEARFGTVNTNIFIGVSAGGYNTTGTSNVAVGANDLALNTSGINNLALGANVLTVNSTGNNNTAVGTSALNANTTGASNSAVGWTALRFNTTGNNNLASGTAALYSSITGSNNVAVGFNALRLITGSSGNVAVGSNAGRFQADGATSLATTTNSVYIGVSARGKDNSDSNSVVIGGNTPIGLGANTTVLGTSSTTLTQLYGAVGIGTGGVYLHRDADAICALRNSTNAQAYRVYNTWTNASNYERFAIDWQTTANTCLLRTEALGTGTLRGMSIQQATGALSFFGATPVVQPAGAGQAAVTLGNTDSEIGGLPISAAYDQTEVTALRDKCEELADDVRALFTLVHALRTALVDLGAIKGAA